MAGPISSNKAQVIALLLRDKLDELRRDTMVTTLEHIRTAAGRPYGDASAQKVLDAYVEL